MVKWKNKKFRSQTSNTFNRNYNVNDKNKNNKNNNNKNGINKHNNATHKVNKQTKSIVDASLTQNGELLTRRIQFVP
eukprot:Pgem_evm1s16915